MQIKREKLKNVVKNRFHYRTLIKMIHKKIESKFVNSVFKVKQIYSCFRNKKTKEKLNYNSKSIVRSNIIER